jgi:hypothetical protein
MRNGPAASRNQQGNGNGGVIEGVGSFGTDLATLALLQLRLATCDLRESTRIAAPLVAGLVALATIGLASTVLGLLGLALWLAQAMDLQPGIVMMGMAVVGLLVSGIISALLIRSLPASLAPFRRSQEELDRNLAWIKTTLVHSGR